MVSPPLGDGRNREPGRTSTVSSSEVSGRSQLRLRVVRVTPGGQHGYWTSLYGRGQVSVVIYFYITDVNCSSSSRSHLIATDTILLQPVLSWTSYFVVPMALMSRLTRSIHPSLLWSSSSSSPRWYHLQCLSFDTVLILSLDIIYVQTTLVQLSCTSL